MMPPSLGEEVELELSHMHETVDAVEGLLRRVDADVTVYDRAAGALLLAQYYRKYLQAVLQALRRPRA
jgi:hypothetical protein